jgi:N-acetylglucosamine-6-phosphate deacetylase
MALVRRPVDSAELERLGTEQIRPELADLDQLSVEELVSLMCSDVRRVPDALDAAEDAIASAVTGVVERLERGGRLVYVGAGTAGRLGMLDAAEAGPTFNVREGQVIGVLAGGTDAFSVPVENAEDDRAGGAEAMRALHISEPDVVVGISASGRTPYVLAAIEAAKAAGALSVGVACNVGTPLGDLADLPIEVAVGPEVIAGSTRMNAGTAQKVVLNILSTAAMVRLGKTHGNLMVDLRPTNEKLRDRATRIVAEIAETTTAEAQEALEASGWKPKVAAAMLVGDLGADDATERLARHEGRLRPTLDSLVSEASEATARPSRAVGWTRLGVGAAFVEGSLVPGDVAMRGGEIVAIGLSRPGTGFVVPGLVDAQVNGYAGVDVLDADPDALLAMGDALLRDGVMAYQPTLITSELGQVQRAARAIGESKARRLGGAVILGIHLEGPFLAPRRSGAHPTERLRAPDPALLEQLLAAGAVTMVTLAPELPGALELIDICHKRGIVVSLGHSAATASEAARGFDVGAIAVTHMFNAMEPMLARAPGLAGEALARKGVAVQIIADGVHVSEEMIRLAFAAAPGRCSLVTDAIAAAGTGDGTVRLGEVSVVVEGGVARRADGTLAGSVGKLRDGLSRLGRLAVPAAEAIGAVTRLPARLVGNARFGELSVGGPADLLVLDDDLEIVRVIAGGRDLEPA